VTRARRALGGSIMRAGALDGFARLLRNLGALNEGSVAGLPDGAGPKAVARFLHHHIDLIRAPDPGFVPPLGLRLVGSVREMRALGRTMGNCLHRIGAMHHPYRCGLATGCRVSSPPTPRP
jgi:hypothetical protein